MYDYLSGVITRVEEESCVLENSGIGYALRISASTRQALESGQEAVLFVHLVHREDVLELLGFSSREERGVFEKLIGVTGIGPKQAQKILSGMSPGGFVQAVASSDLAALTAVPGLGKKTAEKIIFELAGKLESLQGYLEQSGVSAGQPVSREAVAALETLGLSRAAAQNAVYEAERESGGTELSLEALIKAALRHV